MPWSSISKTLTSRLIPQPFSALPGENPVKFLKQIQTMVDIFQPNAALFYLLLTSSLAGNPATWWANNARFFETVPHALAALNQQLISPTYIDDIELRIQKTRQYATEPATAYIHRIQKLYALLPEAATERRIMQQISFGLTTQYALHLGGRNFKTLSEFTSEATRLDFLFFPRDRPSSDLTASQPPPTRNNTPVFETRSRQDARVNTQQQLQLYPRPNPQNNGNTFTRAPQGTFQRNNQPVPRNQNHPPACFNCFSTFHFARSCPEPIRRNNNRAQGNESRGGQF